MTRRLFHLLVAAGLVGFCFMSLCFGTVHIPVKNVLLSIWAGPRSTDVTAQIIWDLRMPRVILAVIAGWVTARSGLLLQVVTGNPLADPYLFGLSSGAATGAIASLVFFAGLFGAMTTVIGAMLGALTATLLLLSLILIRDPLRTPITPGRLILGGIAISFLFTTCTELLVYAGDRNTAHAILFWTMGSFAAADWQGLPPALVGAVVLGFFAQCQTGHLEAMRAGDETAQSLGVRTTALRIWTLVVCALSCGTVVAICGPVPFIGLTVPHLIRATGRDILPELLPFTGIAGAALAVSADLIGRVCLSSQELPVGVVISAFGSFFLGIMVARGRI